MAERELVVTHPIGEGGRFRLGAPTGTVRITGGDGAVAEVRARYRLPSGLDGRIDAQEDGVVDVTRGEGELRVSVHEPRGRRSLGGLIDAARPEVDFDIRLPRAASVRLDAMAGDATLRGLRGDQDLHIVSGDLELHEAGGRIAVTTVSGDVAIRGDRLWLAMTTTSGDIAVDAELVEQLAARSVSGDVIIRAAMGRDAEHTFESVSGDLYLSTASGLTAEVHGVSGSVRSELPMRREKRDGRRLTLVGDGGVALRVRTVSGDVHVDGPRGGSGRARGTEPFGFLADLHPFAADVRGGFGVDPLPPAPPPPPSVPPWPPSVAPPAAPPRPAAAGPHDAPTTVVPSVSPSPPATDQLAILRQLEAGDIDVEEAARRLEALS